jgi:hypothetical protein
VYGGFWRYGRPLYGRPPQAEPVFRRYARARHYGRMSRRHRLAVYVIVGILWLTGCAWLGLDQLFAVRGPFGIVPHPWEPPILLLHGVAAILSMYLFGWVTARHVLRWWSAGLRRVSGSALAALLVILIVSGFALFFLTDERWQHATGVAHEVLGVGIALFAIQHWLFRRREDAER